MTSADSPSPEARPTPHRRLFWYTIVIAIVVIALDQLTKWWAETSLADGKRVPVIGELIQFLLVYNPGAAFSIGTGATWIFAILAAIAVVVIGLLAWRVGSKGWMVAFGLLLGGATTHLGDRLFRAPGFGRGHVVDFIDYAGFFIGNVADIAIFGGVVMLLILMLLGIRLRGGRGTVR
ncbi:signal peptidase II [Glaciihabitans sp. UYNi722]|uniref:signal peptidase II n=1 Tax=Glaciihabitans sp. UYNi722 TaxID=3156344 RepID=UPI003396E264